MRRIESQIDTNAPDFKANHAAMSARLKEFHARQHATRFERPQRDIDRLARQNKLGVRERLKLLLDPGTPFYAKLIMPDGKFSNFEIDREMAHMMVVELTYHMYLQTGRILNAPRNEV